MSWLDFIIIGTQKGGTTSLSVNLPKHPEISTDSRDNPTESEGHYFDRDIFFKNNKPCKISEVSKKELKFFVETCPILYKNINTIITNYSDKSTLFLYKCRLFFTINKIPESTLLNTSFEEVLHMKRLCGDILVGDKTPLLMVDRRYIERIYNCFPHVKLIMSLRDPIARAYSQWKMMCSNGSETRTFNKCIRDEIARLESHAETPKNDRLFVYRGLYDKQIEVIYELFDTKQVLVIWAEHMKQDMKRTYSKIFDFLGVAKVAIDFKYDVNVSVGKSKCNVPISQSLMKHMKQFYGTRNNVPSIESGGYRPRKRLTQKSYKN